MLFTFLEDNQINRVYAAPTFIYSNTQASCVGDGEIDSIKLVVTKSLVPARWMAIHTM